MELTYPAGLRPRLVSCNSQQHLAVLHPLAPTQSDLDFQRALLRVRGLLFHLDTDRVSVSTRILVLWKGESQDATALTTYNDEVI